MPGGGMEVLYAHEYSMILSSYVCRFRCKEFRGSYFVVVWWGLVCVCVFE